MTPVRTSPYYPQSNGKIERWHTSLKRECIRPGTPLSLKMRGVRFRFTWSITTTCVSTGPSATSRQRTCLRGISRRFRPSGIGSWKRRGNSGRVAASGPREERRSLVSGQPEERKNRPVRAVFSPLTDCNECYQWDRNEGPSNTPRGKA